MSHKNDGCMVNIKMDKVHYDFLFTLANAYKKTPADVARMLCEAKLDEIARKIKEQEKGDA